MVQSSLGQGDIRWSFVPFCICFIIYLYMMCMQYKLIKTMKPHCKLHIVPLRCVMDQNSVQSGLNTTTLLVPKINVSISNSPVY